MRKAAVSLHCCYYLREYLGTVFASPRIMYIPASARYQFFAIVVMGAAIITSFGKGQMELLDNFQFTVLVPGRGWGRYAPTRNCPRGKNLKFMVTERFVLS